MSNPYNATSGSFTGAGVISNITLGFNPLQIKVTNETDGIEWNWNAGYVTAGLTQKVNSTGPVVSYTTASPGDIAPITVTGSGSGPNGFSISAAVAVNTKQMSWVATRVGS